MKLKISLKFLADWFFTSEMRANVDNALRADDGIYFLRLLLIKDIFLLQILIKSILMKIIVLMKKIQILLFMSDFWFYIADLQYTKLRQ